MILSDKQIKQFQSAVWKNYHDNGRSFPWRKTKNPYEILVSELMLQQTQTERVVPKYESWLKQFPTAESLAEASLANVLTAWSGLGYNRRAKFLQNACKEIVTRFSGKFPKTAEELETLPGVGPYTARAVCAFAFNKPETVIETNIRSVFIFTFFNQKKTETDLGSAQKDTKTDNKTSQSAKKTNDSSGIKVPDSEILPLIEQTVDTENPREWYYALMDYGAELKKKVVNPSRRSSGYTKQSKFEGSLRQARGAILRQLAGKSIPKKEDSKKNCVDTCGLTLKQIAAAENIEYERIEKAALKLKEEELIEEFGSVYRIKN